MALYLYNATKGCYVGELEIADTFFKRALGLMFKKTYKKLLLFEINGKTSFHSMFCFFPITLFVVKNGRVVKKHILKPFSVVFVEGDVVIETNIRNNVCLDVGDEVVIVADKGEK